MEANWEKSFLKQSIFLLLKWFFFRGICLSCLHNNRIKNALFLVVVKV